LEGKRKIARLEGETGSSLIRRTGEECSNTCGEKRGGGEEVLLGKWGRKRGREITKNAAH